MEMELGTRPLLHRYNLVTVMILTAKFQVKFASNSVFSNFLHTNERVRQSVSLSSLPTLKIWHSLCFRHIITINDSSS